MSRMFYMENVNGRYLINNSFRSENMPRIQNLMMAASPVGSLCYKKPKHVKANTRTVYKNEIGSEDIEGGPSSLIISANLKRGKLLIAFAVTRDAETGKRSAMKLGSFAEGSGYDLDERPGRIQISFDSAPMPSTLESIGLVECNYMVKGLERKMKGFMQFVPVKVKVPKQSGVAVSVSEHHC